MSDDLPDGPDPATPSRRAIDEGGTAPARADEAADIVVVRAPPSADLVPDWEQARPAGIGTAASPLPPPTPPQPAAPPERSAPPPDSSLPTGVERRKRPRYRSDQPRAGRPIHPSLLGRLPRAEPDAPSTPTPPRRPARVSAPPPTPPARPPSTPSSTPLGVPPTATAPTPTAPASPSAPAAALAAPPTTAPGAVAPALPPPSSSAAPPPPPQAPPGGWPVVRRPPAADPVDGQDDPTPVDLAAERRIALAPTPQRSVTIVDRHGRIPRNNAPLRIAVAGVLLLAVIGAVIWIATRGDGAAVTTVDGEPTPSVEATTDPFVPQDSSVPGGAAPPPSTVAGGTDVTTTPTPETTQPPVDAPATTTPVFVPATTAPPSAPTLPPATSTPPLPAPGLATINDETVSITSACTSFPFDPITADYQVFSFFVQTGAGRFVIDRWFDETADGVNVYRIDSATTPAADFVGTASDEGSGFKALAGPYGIAVNPSGGIFECEDNVRTSPTDLEEAPYTQGIVDLCAITQGTRTDVVAILAEGGGVRIVDDGESVGISYTDFQFAAPLVDPTGTIDAEGTVLTWSGTVAGPDGSRRFEMVADVGAVRTCTATDLG